MAQLLLARDRTQPGTAGMRVIKRIVPAFAREAESIVMFLDEARIAAQLRHPNIVRVHDVDMSDGELLLVMEFLHGQDASSVLRRARSRGARIPTENAVAVAVAVATGLHHAHETRGPDGRPLEIVHRDVSPHNVILTYDGDVKIIDFGIAKAVDNLSRTRTGVFKGRMAYASPEQIRGEAIDRRADVFSLGVLLFELTTGRAPLTNASDFEAVKAISEGRIPRPSAVDPSYPDELDRIVARAMAADRGERYATAHELRHDLLRFASRRRLDLSPGSLARTVRDLFPDEVDRWCAARDVGGALEQHLLATRTANLCPPTRRALERARPSRAKIGVAGLLAAVAVAGLVSAFSSAGHRPPGDGAAGVTGGAGAGEPVPARYAGRIERIGPVHFGDGRFCRYTITLLDVVIDVGLRPSNQVGSASVQTLAVEGLDGPCTDVPLAPERWTYSLDSAMVDGGRTFVALRGSRTQRPRHALTLDLIPAGRAYLARLSWKRTDRPPPLDWSIVAQTVLLRE